MTLFESGAILLYLGEKYGGLEKRYGAASWVSAPELMLSHG
jgi:glutathione S-transferase